jgi:hypothetical protein
VTWEYRQSTGHFSLNDAYVATGYSGRGEGLNNPSEESVQGQGPIPHGKYKIGPAITHPTAGPIAMRLTACEGTDTCGRDGFLIHGDNQSLNHTASHGCIILPKAIRQMVADSDDKDLIVLP